MLAFISNLISPMAKGNPEIERFMLLNHRWNTHLADTAMRSAAGNLENLKENDENHSE